VETSPDTILRRVKRSHTLALSPAVVGVDDWAWRKGQRYGTILVDLERHTPIDLLADRSAESLETWLKAHPGVKVISRDRAGVYADGATKGAPEAVQVADRFHLLCNLTSAVERSLESKRGQLQKAMNPDIEENPASAEVPPIAGQPRRTRAEQNRDERRAHRLDRYNRVVELHRQGMSQNDISRTLHLERKTVRRYLRAGQFPERAFPRRRPPAVAAFREYLEKRWNEGCHNATQLWHEIEKQGYQGKRSMVARFVAVFRCHGTKSSRQQSAPAKPKRRALSPRQAAMLIAKKPEDLTEDQQTLITKLEKSVPEIATMHTLIKDFRGVLRERKPEGLQEWSTAATACGLPELQRFSEGLERDTAAVMAAIQLPWSNGQVEGQVHRLKLIKPQMYGRAGFPLLRSRVLPFCTQPSVVPGRAP
jgi:transposase